MARSTADRFQEQERRFDRRQDKTHQKADLERLAAARLGRLVESQDSAATDFAAAHLRTGELGRAGVALAQASQQATTAGAGLDQGLYGFGGPRPGGQNAAVALRDAENGSKAAAAVGEADLARLGPGDGLSGPMTEGLSEALADAGVTLNIAKVRVHTGAEADALCRRVGARALASGHHIAFRNGLFQPATRAGLELLVHELTHVGQFEGNLVGDAPTPESAAGGQPVVKSEALEAHASQIAATVTASGHVERVVARADPSGEQTAEGPTARTQSATIPGQAAQFGPVQLDGEGEQEAGNTQGQQQGTPPARQPTHQLVGISGGHRLSSAISDAFLAACSEIQGLTDIDLSQGLGDSTRGLSRATTKVGADNYSWHKTGRAFDLNQGRRWVIREDAGGGAMFFRLFLLANQATIDAETAARNLTGPEAVCTEAQPDGPGPHLTTFPRETTFHYNREGNRAFTRKFVDVTAIFERHGFERIQAHRGWQSSYNKREWWHYQNTDGLGWFEALQQIYSDEDLRTNLRALLRHAGATTFPSRAGVPAHFLDEE